jgi:hypothetical protein
MSISCTTKYLAINDRIKGVKHKIMQVKMITDSNIQKSISAATTTQGRMVLSVSITNDTELNTIMNRLLYFDSQTWRTYFIYLHLV